MAVNVSLPMGGNDERVRLEVEEARVIEAVSPTAEVERVEGGARITVQDYQHSSEAVVYDGERGETGPQGPQGEKGEKGDTGAAGHTPVRGTDYWTPQDQQIVVEQAEEIATSTARSVATTTARSVAITTAQQTAQSMLNNPTYKESIKGDKGDTGATGDTGPQGPQGDPGVGIPSGGTAGQVLTKASGTDYDATWTTPQGGGVTDVQVNGTSVVSEGVANVPRATNSIFGVVRPHVNTFGFNNDGVMMISGAAASHVKEAASGWRPIMPNMEHAATFYGLTKAAGVDMASSSNAVGQYTESAKSAIHTMLNGSVSVSGTTPSITALPGIRYICGEVSTLDITLPASGCVDVTFVSGSTPTVLTVTPPSGVTVKWANSFNPSALDADTTYEINVADGLGVAGSWT